MKVLLSAFIGSHNLGDEAIAEVVIERLSNDSQIELTILSRDIDKTSRYSNFHNVNVINAKQSTFYKQLRHNDCLVLGGGGIIQDESSALNLVYYYQQALYARMLGKPVFLFFVGVGPIKTKAGIILIRRLSKIVSHSVVRDPESKELLTKFGFKPENVATAFDIVFNFPVVSSAKTNQKEYLLFCPRDWFFTGRILPTKQALKKAKRNSRSRLYIFRNSLRELTEEILNRNSKLEVVAAPFFFTQDLDLIFWIKNNLPDNLAKRFKVIEREMTPKEFVHLAHNSKAVLGVRLHSLILAATCKIPLIPLVYSAKVDSLVQYLELGRNATKLIEPKLDIEQTANKVENAMTTKKIAYADKLEHIKHTNLLAVEETIKLMKKLVKDGK